MNIIQSTNLKNISLSLDSGKYSYDEVSGKWLMDKESNKEDFESKLRQHQLGVLMTKKEGSDEVTKSKYIMYLNYLYTNIEFIQDDLEKYLKNLEINKDKLGEEIYKEWLQKFNSMKKDKNISKITLVYSPEPMASLKQFTSNKDVPVQENKSNPFTNFSREQRPIIKSEHPRMKESKIRGQIGKKWKTMSQDEKEKYQQIPQQKILPTPRSPQQGDDFQETYQRLDSSFRKLYMNGPFFNIQDYEDIVNLLKEALNQWSKPITREWQIKFMSLIFTNITTAKGHLIFLRLYPSFCKTVSTKVDKYIQKDDNCEGMNDLKKLLSYVKSKYSAIFSLASKINSYPVSDHDFADLDEFVYFYKNSSTRKEVSDRITFEEDCELCINMWYNHLYNKKKSQKGSIITLDEGIRDEIQSKLRLSDEDSKKRKRFEDSESEEEVKVDESSPKRLRKENLFILEKGYWKYCEEYCMKNYITILNKDTHLSIQLGWMSLNKMNKAFYSSSEFICDRRNYNLSDAFHRKDTSLQSDEGETIQKVFEEVQQLSKDMKETKEEINNLIDEVSLLREDISIHFDNDSEEEDEEDDDDDFVSVSNTPEINDDHFSSSKKIFRDRRSDTNPI